MNVGTGLVPVRYKWTAINAVPTLFNRNRAAVSNKKGVTTRGVPGLTPLSTNKFMPTTVANRSGLGLVKQ